MRISVWAPRLDRLQVVVGTDRWEAKPDERGWCHFEPDLDPGTDYHLVDGQTLLPDPRSMWQPSGIDGPSRIVDHSSFQWSDSAWTAPSLKDVVIYELHVGTFTPQGTFDAAIEKLPYLLSLGVGAIELMPVAEFSGTRGWGYDGVGLFAPHHSYGGPDGLKRLIDAAHGSGIAVIMDVVYNHLGPAGNHLDRFGPYFTERYVTPWGMAINLDGPGSDEVRRFIIDNASMWIRDYHCDGLRLDAVHAIHDSSATHILEELGDELRRVGGGRTIWTIAESDLNDPRLVKEAASGGYGLTAAWSDDLHHSIHAALTGESDGYYADFGSDEQIVKALADVYVFDGGYSRFRDKRHGRPVEDLPRDRFVVFSQNHDQIGNRAMGERLVHLCGRPKAEAAAAIVLSSCMVPLIFQGEEWASSSPFLYFTAHDDPELADAVRRGRRDEFAAFGWDPASVPDPQSPETFDASKLDWSEPQAEEHSSMLQWYRDLIRLRQSIPGIRDPDPHSRKVALVDDVLVTEGRGFTSVISLKESPAVVPLGQGSLVLARRASLGPAGIELEGWGVAFLQH